MLEEKKRFVTSALENCETPVHRKRKEKKKKVDDKAARVLGPADKTIHIREEEPTVQLCGDSGVARKWNSGLISLGQRYRGRTGQIQNTLHSLWEKIAHAITKIDDYVKHIFRGHNLEADHMATVGAEGQRQIIVD